MKGFLLLEGGAEFGGRMAEPDCVPFGSLAVLMRRYPSFPQPLLRITTINALEEWPALVQTLGRQ